ncbi:LANO_0E06898g1_1 [Lachancea nothofagi CBS 11611]|uniref:LANO_0E06898g1_1 n=1 Tax=Lachancea nothofagi CBS 11611 TaxID=1266666 RepID=A0A1G4JUF1_9SACH|nr:LANO_0E06898g1_1 [Lachancea nothofagi CBS 11611]
MEAGMAYHDQFIDDLGVSQRLGNSVLSELDYRATNKASNLRPGFQDSRNALQLREAERFDLKHNTDFQTMESIQSHYAAQKSPALIAQEADQAMVVEENENYEEKPGTPKRESDQNLHSSSKRMRDKDGKSRDSDVSVYSPVTDITRRIRRLRVKQQNQTPRENRSKINSVRNTPLSGPPPRISFDNKPQATFAKPTFTSINRENKPGAIFSRLKKPDKLDKTQSFRRPSAKNQAPINLPQPTAVVAPTSVFQRLYEQSTISRSNSSNAISHSNATSMHSSLGQKPVTSKKTTTIPKSQTMKNLRSELEAQKPAVSRSKSSYTLSIKENPSTKLPKSTSTTFGKPVWR